MKPNKKQQVTTRIDLTGAKVDGRSLTPCNVRRAAEILGTSQAGVYMRKARREIPFRIVGKRGLIFFEEELLAFLNQSAGLRLEEINK